jgi:hypothetical protein
MAFAMERQQRFVQNKNFQEKFFTLCSGSPKGGGQGWRAQKTPHRAGFRDVGAEGGAPWISGSWR